jgi:hypothetical protein
MQYCLVTGAANNHKQWQGLLSRQYQVILDIKEISRQYPLFRDIKEIFPLFTLYIGYCGKFSG